MADTRGRIGDVDLRDVIVDREPPVRVAPHGEILEPPPVPRLSTEDVRIRLRERREPTDELLPEPTDVPDDGSLEPPIVRQVRPLPRRPAPPLPAWLALFAAVVLALAAASWWL